MPPGSRVPRRRAVPSAGLYLAPHLHRSEPAHLGGQRNPRGSESAGGSWQSSHAGKGKSRQTIVYSRACFPLRGRAPTLRPRWLGWDGDDAPRPGHGSSATVGAPSQPTPAPDLASCCSAPSFPQQLEVRLGMNWGGGQGLWTPPALLRGALGLILHPVLGSCPTAASLGLGASRGAWPPSAPFPMALCC